MTERRRRPSSYDQGPAHYTRILDRIDQNATRVEDLFDRLNGRLDRVDRDLAARELGEDSVRAELREFKREFGDLRDVVALADGRRTAAAAEGAAKGAAQVAASIASPVVAQSVWKTTWGRVVAGAIGFTTVMVAANNVPDAVRGWDKFWAYLRNEPPAASAKQDTTDGK